MRLRFWTAATILALASGAWAETVVLNDGFTSAAVGSPAPGWTKGEAVGSGEANVMNTTTIHIPTGTTTSGGNFLGRNGMGGAIDVSNTWEYRTLTGLCTDGRTYRVTAYYAGGLNGGTFPNDYTAKWQIGLQAGAYNYNNIRDDVDTLPVGQTLANYASNPTGVDPFGLLA